MVIIAKLRQSWCAGISFQIALNARKDRGFAGNEFLSSNLLTHLASAPEDSHEDTSKVILTALMIGFCFGMFLTAFTLIFSAMLGIDIGMSELLTGLLVLLAVALAVYASLKISSHKMKQQLIEKVEEIAGLFAKK